jgi:hypothetical protein
MSNRRKKARIRAGRKSALSQTATSKPVLLRQAALSDLNVDRESGVIQGAAVITVGEARGHGFYIDRTTLQQVADAIQAKGSIPVRYVHPKSSEDGNAQDPLPMLAGEVFNARVEGDCVRADVRLLNSFDRRDHLLEIAERMPGQMGLSIEFYPEFEHIDGKDFARVAELRAVDFVGNPAANPNGLLQEKPNGEKKMDAELMALLRELLRVPDEITDEELPVYVKAELAKQKEAEAAMAEGDEDNAPPVEDVPALSEKDAEAVKLAERKRADSIRGLCKLSGLADELADKHVADGTSLNDFCKVALREKEAMSKKGNVTGAAPAAITSESKVNDQVVEAAICLSAKLPDPDKHYSEQTLDAANKHFRSGVTLGELLLMKARANGFTGYNVRRNLREVLQLAFSTNDISGITSNIANKFILEGWLSFEDTCMRVSSKRAVSDFKINTSYRLTGNQTYELVPPGGEIKHGTLGDEAYTNKADTYAHMLGITRTDIINDDSSALTEVPRRLGRGSKIKLNDVFWTEFLDNASFFAVGNNNYASGATTALGIDSLTTAEQKFFDQTDPNGDPLGVNPAILLVPNGLFVTGTSLMNSTELRNTTGSTKYPVNNPHAGKFRVERSSYLANSNYTGYSALKWYLLADPQDLPVIEIVFLNGNEQPTVETADADFNTLGIQMRGYHDFGVAKQEYRGGVAMKGEA